MGLIDLAYRILLKNRSNQKSIQAVKDLFHILYCDVALRGGTWRDTFWFGVPVLKCPLDLWVYQEIVSEVKPDMIVECGTHRGGTALFLANVCDLADKGRIITIDTVKQEGSPAHARIEYVIGSSLDLRVFERVRASVRPTETVCVILDSDHRMSHVLQELRLYGSLVTVGSYMIVEDTNINGHPVLPDFGPGPMEAVREFLKETRSFEPDTRREKLLLTFNPHGFLKRVRQTLSLPVVAVKANSP